MPAPIPVGCFSLRVPCGPWEQNNLGPVREGGAVGCHRLTARLHFKVVFAHPGTQSSLWENQATLGSHQALLHCGKEKVCGN